jgi:hypothetical protein
LSEALHSGLHAALKNGRDGCRALGASVAISVWSSCDFLQLAVAERGKNVLRQKILVTSNGFVLTLSSLLEATMATAIFCSRSLRSPI